MKFLTWNIQSGGGKRIPKIVSAISAVNPDFITLTEFRSANEATLCSQLNSMGYAYIDTSRPPSNENGVLIASKYGFERVKDEIESDGQRWTSVILPEKKLNILSIHIPGAPDHKFTNGVGISGKKRKELFWENVIAFAKKSEEKKSVILGDFNTGLKEDAEGTPFHLSHYITNLRSVGFIDTWRYLHPIERDYTWYSQQRAKGQETKDHNGFRLDYIFISPLLKGAISSSIHIHSVRNDKISDHSMVVTELMV